MKSLLPLALMTAVALVVPASLSAQIINIDFLSQRPGESVASNAAPGTVGAAGGGDTFNGLSAIDLVPVASDPTGNGGPTDDITVAGANLFDSHDNGTTVGFTISHVGSDNAGNFTNGIINGAYLFLNSANNHQGSTIFTISGLTSPAVDLYFYTADDGGLNNPTITFASGTTSTPFTTTGIFNANDTTEFLNVPVVNGEVIGNYGAGRVIIFGGMTIEEVPEPSTWALLLGGIALLLGIQRFRKLG